jgi:ADP-ribose 1''-phosphate phosphatase
MIEEIKGNLFDAPKGSLLVHACNTQGVWGAGIAATFARLYPSYLKGYEAQCHAKGPRLLGTALILQGRWHKVGCLFTSTGYGSKALYQDDIIQSTRESLIDLFTQVSDTEVVNMPRINSGLFRVPWDLTREVLEEFPEREFKVWVP